MADNENILTRLGKLFQNQIIVRKTNNGQVRVKDVEFSQTALTSNFIDRYNKIHSSGYGPSSYVAKQNANAYDVTRKELFRDYELMDADPIISSALDIYCDESTVDNESSLEKTLERDVPVLDVSDNQNRDGPAGFVVPRDFVMLPSKGVIYPVD